MKYKYNFYDRKKSNKKKIIFVVAIFIVAIVISSFLFRNSNNKVLNKISNVILAPINSISNGINNLGDNFFSYFANKKKIEEENDVLKKQLEEAKYINLETKKIEEENASLKRMLEIKSNYQHFNLKYGRIILREHDNWTKKFTIDIGKNEGIALNQAVISSNGLVGYISEVNDTTSVVSTILDSLTSVSVNIGTINEPAILKGDPNLKSNNRLKLEYIQIDTVISLGDMLYTSGLGNTYPSTIPVGKIIEIKGSKNDMNRYAIVEPLVDIASIKEVAIIVE